MSMRTDPFGGSWRGWEALLTTHGTSILAAQPLLIMDLSGRKVLGGVINEDRRAA